MLPRKDNADLEKYNSTDNFKTATAFSATSRTFQLIWQTHAAIICRAVLVHTIPCPDHAFGYVKAQLLMQPKDCFKHALDCVKSRPLNITSLKKKGLKITEVTKQFCENSDTACRAFEYYEDRGVHSMSGEGPSRGSSSPAQRIVFLRAWYRIHVLARLSSRPLPRELFDSIGMLELEQMMEVFCWLIYCCPENIRLDLDITYGMEGNVGLPKSLITPLRWYDLEAGLFSFFLGLMGYLHKHRWNKDGGIHFWKVLLREIYLDSITSRNGVNWAEDSDLSD